MLIAFRTASNNNKLDEMHWKPTNLAQFSIKTVNNKLSGTGVQCILQNLDDESSTWGIVVFHGVEKLEARDQS